MLFKFASRCYIFAITVPKTNPVINLFTTQENGILLFHHSFNYMCVVLSYTYPVALVFWVLFINALDFYLTLVVDFIFDMVNILAIWFER